MFPPGITFALKATWTSFCAFAVTPVSELLALMAKAIELAEPFVDSPIRTSLILISFADNAVPLTVAVSIAPETDCSLNPIALTSAIVPRPSV